MGDNQQIPTLDAQFSNLAIAAGPGLAHTDPEAGLDDETEARHTVWDYTRGVEDMRRTSCFKVCRKTQLLIYSD